MTVGDKIYYCRIEQHMTQKELGEKTGIDAATIGKYERGRLNPKIETLKKIADALGVGVNVLYEMDETRSEQTDEKKNDLLQAYSQLNADGQRIAVERVEELTQIPKYKRQ